MIKNECILLLNNTVGNHVSWHTDLCMWDRSQWGRRRRQRERPRGRKVSGTPVWSACPSGTAGRHRLGEVQTHLRKKTETETKKTMSKHTKGNSHWIFEEALDSCCLLQGTEQVYVVKKRRCQNFPTKQLAIGPFGCSCRCEKTNTAGQHISNAWDRFVWISPSLSLALSFFSAAPSVTLCSFALSLSQRQFSPLRLFCLSGEFDIKNLKEAWFPSLSSPPILWQILCEIALLLLWAPPPPTTGLTNFQG